MSLILPLKYYFIEDGVNGVYSYVQTTTGNVVFHPNGSLVINSVRQSGMSLLIAFLF